MTNEAGSLITIEMLRACGVSKNDTALAALSGGADSTALLLSLKSLLDEGAIAGLYAAHLNHGIRGDAAMRDQAFCVSLCREMGISLVCEQADVPAYAKARGLSLETAARETRYAFLERVRASLGADCIVTAHQQGDQAETVLMHLLRGCGVSGLCGMPSRTGMIARPLLTRSRGEIEAYLQACGASYCIDETNASADAFRNRVRNELLPALEAFCPHVKQALCKTALLCRADEDCLGDLASAAARRLRDSDGGLDRKKLSRQHRAIRARIIRKALMDSSGGDVTSADIERVSKLCGLRTGTRIELSGGRSAWVDANRLHIGAYPAPNRYEVPFLWAGETVTPAGTLIAETVTAYQTPRDAFEAYLDIDALPNELVVRTRRDGDRFFPLGAPGTRKLKSVLIDKKIPRCERDMPLLCANSEVYFAVGLTISERARVRPETERILHITFLGGAQP